MGRRASTRTSPIWIILLVIVFLAAALLGHVMFGQAKDHFRTYSSLDIASYLDNANSMRGNVYKVTGKVHNLLSWNPDVGRLISVEVDDLSPQLIPVLVPFEHETINLQKGQDFSFLLRVEEQGILTAADLKKL